MLLRNFVLAFVLSLSAATLAAAQQPAATPSAAPAGAPAVEDPAITAAVRKQFFAWQSGNVDRAAYADEAARELTPALVAQISAGLQKAGDPTKFTYVDRKTQGEYRVYTYTVDTPQAKLQITYALDGAGKIAGIRFLPLP